MSKWDSVVSAQREEMKLYQAFGVLRECFGDNGVWADPSRYRRQCWTRDFGLAVQPLLLACGQPSDLEIAAKHLQNLEQRQGVDGQIPILFLDGVQGHARFFLDKATKSVRDGKMSFMLGRYLQGKLGQLTPGTRDSEVLYVVAACEFQKKTGKMPVSEESLRLAMRYIKRNLLDVNGLLKGCDWRDTMEKQLGEKTLLTNNALLYHAYDLMQYRTASGLHAPTMKRKIAETFWEKQNGFWDLLDWPGNRRFDPLGASLAVLYDLVHEDRYPYILKSFQDVDTPFGVTIKCRHNPTSPEEARVIDKTDGVVVWPFIVGFSVLALMHMAKKCHCDPILFRGMAQDQMAKLVKLEGFREWYDPATGCGYGADRQLWSATLFLRAHLAMKGAASPG